jgi:hypothetical protein
MSLPNPPDWPECHHEATEDGSEGKRLDCTHSGVEMVDLLCDLCEGQARNLLCHCLHLTPGSADPFKSAIFDQCYQTLHNRPFSHSPPKAYSIIRFLETQLERVSRTLVSKHRWSLGVLTYLGSRPDSFIKDRTTYGRSWVRFEAVHKHSHSRQR